MQAKCQAGVEFMIISSIVIVLLTITVIIYATGITENNSLSKWLDAKRICERVAFAINSAASLGYGFSQQIELNDKVDTHLLDFDDFQVTVLANYSMVIVKSRNITSNLALPLSNVSTHCRIQTMNVTNITGHSTFDVKQVFIAHGIEGGAVIENRV